MAHRPTEETTAHYSTADAQPVTLAPLVVPDTDLEGVNADKVFDVTAADVVGYLGETNGASNTDFYSFTAQAGTLINFQLMSAALTRSVAPAGTPPTGDNQGPFNTYLVIYNSSGQVIEYNDDSFQDPDSSIIDLTLPTTGTYYAMVTSSPNSAALRPAVDRRLRAIYVHFRRWDDCGVSLHNPRPGDTMYAGSGDDTIIAGSADDTIADPPPDHDRLRLGRREHAGADPGFERLGRPQPNGQRGLPRHPDRLVPRPNWRHVTSLRLARCGRFRPADRRRHRHHLHVHPGQRRNLHGDIHGHRPERGLGAVGRGGHLSRRPAGPDRHRPPRRAPSPGVSTSINLGTLAITGIGPFTDTVNWGDGQTSTFSPTSSGSNALAHTYATAGTYTIDETVSEYYGGTTTASFLVDVTAASTSTTLTSTAASAVYGQSVTFTATVAGPADPTGTVAFYAGAVTPADQIGTGTLSVDNGRRRGHIQHVNRCR